MAAIIIYALASVVVVSLISLVGILVVPLGERRLHRIIYFLVALAVGALLGDAFIHLIPEAIEEQADTTLVALLVIAGMLLFFLLEKVLRWHHGHHGHHETDPVEAVEEHVAHGTHGTIRPIGRMILVSDGVHNLIDGVIIGASYLVSVEVGIASTIAIVLHEIPQEVGDFGVLLHAGYTKMRALMVNFISATLAIIGAVIALAIGNATEMLLNIALPVAAGTFIYIAAADLVPELHKQHSARRAVGEFAGILIGVFAMYLLLFIN